MLRGTIWFPLRGNRRGLGKGISPRFRGNSTAEGTAEGSTVRQSAIGAEPLWKIVHEAEPSAYLALGGTPGKGMRSEATNFLVEG